MTFKNVIIFIALSTPWTLVIPTIVLLYKKYKEKL